MPYTDFYVTKGSSAANTNGGGPSLGTNDAPVDAVTDASATHDGSGSHTVTSTAQFVNAAVDDFVCWDADSAPVYGVITAKASSSSVTILSMSGAAFGVLTPSKVNVGGAWATIQHGVDTVVSAFVNTNGDPFAVNIGPGTWNGEGQIDIDAGWTDALPLTVEGYNSSAHDMSTTQPTISGTTGGGDVAGVNIAGNNVIVRNLNVTNSVNGDRAINVNSTSVWIDRCEVETTEAGAGADGIYINIGQTIVSRCYIPGVTRGIGIYCNAQGPILIGNYVKDTNGDGLRMNRNTVAAFNVVDTAGGDGISNVGYRCTVISNTVYNSSSDDIALTGDTPAAVFNNILYSAGAYNISQTAEEWFACDFNAFGAAGTGDYQNLDAALRGVADVALAADPFTNAAAGDFTLDTSGVTELGAKGFPGAMLDGTNVGYLDIGALRHEDPAGVGGMFRRVPVVIGAGR